MPPAVVLAVCAVALAFVAAAADDDDATLMTWSLEACQSDVPCAVHFQLPTGRPPEPYERQRFVEMMRMFLARRDQSDGAVPMVTSCINGTVDNAALCAEVEWLWLGMMRSANVCEVNEEWVVGHGCHCEDGKHCDTDCTQAIISDLWSTWVVFGILGIGVLFFLMQSINEFRELSAKQEAALARDSIAHYTLQAQLYAASAALPSAPTAPPPAAAPTGPVLRQNAGSALNI